MLVDDLQVVCDGLPSVGARVRVGSPAGWVRVGDGLDELLEHPSLAGAHRGFVGATVAAAASRAVVDAGWLLLLRERVLPDLDRVTGHVAGGACWFDEVAVAGPADGGDLPVLHERFVDALVMTLTPWFAAVRGRAPFGIPGMWGQTADLLGGVALWSGLEPEPAWDEAMAVVDRLAARVPALRARPRLVGGLTVKGTCCLWYRTGASPCETCPVGAFSTKRTGSTSP